MIRTSLFEGLAGDMAALRRDVRAVQHDVWGEKAVWTVTTITPIAPPQATCAYCGRRRPAGRETCLGCGAGEVEP